ncbi:MAG: sigma-70 family RNA polymerase sigma factor [Bryobacteraceae bacterium]|nr:sigma-70 family RNA polymerase sigma factor [Bryobacteraceae bacterium]
MLFLILSAILGPAESRRLIERLRARDAAALGELYDCYGAVVYAIILRIARDRATAEDLTQEVFLRVWNRIPTFDAERGSLSTWLLTIARHSAIDFLRSRGGKQERLNVSIDAMERPLAGGNAETELQTAGDAKRVRAAMDRLEPKHRQLLELAYFDGLSQSEMAEKLELPLGTVKTWVRSALRQLRENLQQPSGVNA